MRTITSFALLSLCFLFAISSCKKEQINRQQQNNNKRATDVGAYVVHASVRKLDSVGPKSYNYELSFWVTTDADTVNALQLPGNLLINGELKNGGKVMPVSIQLKLGSFITRKLYKLTSPVIIKGSFSVPGSYQGKSIKSDVVAMEKPYNLKKIHVQGTGFADEDGKPFIPWGMNYTNPDQIPLMDDVWFDNAKWEIIKQDFREMKLMGFNVVRIHLQFHHFMTYHNQPNIQALTRLRELVKFCESIGIYLDITGLCSYFKQDPDWYVNTGERDRWNTQALFWRGVATAAEGSPAVFAFNLINEPITPSTNVSEWIPGEDFGGYWFVQHLTRQPAGRGWETVTRQWITQMKTAIRLHDDKTLITVGFIGLGVISKFNDLLDYNSAHIYPESGKINEAINFVNNNVSSKPLVIEETGPPSASFNELRTFINTTRPKTAGFISHYFGKTIEQLEQENTISAAIWREWYKIFGGELNPYNSKPVY
ncbi:hypothetical protein EOD41_00230 [Mucilaginibacter limnophilus]|uniref:Glycoside hydrolase family 5 domain-containing protein n=1 Tax=Mucilaginibacter limnophilus TaxID=1932778 RepID=A0A3S2UQX6_9SPHI|nr:cellulase family glycosylhydrolase [Mucilaginibacter limnophilus]RVU02404.1 hypothetical protein EOD41_00230 [Mucilaginibacter limnophilus]